MARDFRIPIDMHQLEIRNLVQHLLASAPGSPTEGQCFHNTATHVFEFYNGTSWVTLGTLDQISAPAGNVAFGGFKATNLGTPTAGTDGATKGYVDGRSLDVIAAAAATGADVSFNSHKITSLATPTTSTDGATKGYVDGRSLDTIAGAAATAADVSMNSHKLTNVTDPASAQDAATKSYVDAASVGLNVKNTVAAATTSALAANTYANGTLGVGATLTANANGAIGAIDGVTLAVGNRVLVQNEATSAHDGIYTVTALGDGSNPYVLTRATDIDTAAEITKGAYTWVVSGTTNGKQAFFQTAAVTTIASDTQTWTQFSGTADITAGNGLTKTGNSLDVGAGTGISVAADAVAVDTSVVVRKYAADVGDNSSTTITVTHSLGTSDTTVTVYDKTTPFAEQYPEVRHTDANTITLVFAVAPTTAQFRVVVHG